MDPLITFVGTVTCSIIILTVFFTVWNALVKKVKGNEPVETVNYFKDLPEEVNIELNNGRRYEKVKIVGVFSCENDIPYEMSSFISIQKDNKKTFLKSSAIRIIEEV